jgi:DNA integrity scanning protein DisA with diadenylate cyclase activity
MIFNKFYFVLTFLLFITEIFIGRFLDNAIIRPYGGDFLVVILVYCFVKSFVKTPVITTAIGVLVFAYLIEVSQYFHLVNVLGWQHIKAARIVLGTSFSFIDLVTYTLGILLVLIIEKAIHLRRLT